MEYSVIFVDGKKQADGIQSGGRDRYIRPAQRPATLSFICGASVDDASRETDVALSAGRSAILFLHFNGPDIPNSTEQIVRLVCRLRDVDGRFVWFTGGRLVGNAGYVRVAQALGPEGNVWLGIDQNRGNLLEVLGGIVFPGALDTLFRAEQLLEASSVSGLPTIRTIENALLGVVSAGDCDDPFMQFARDESRTALRFLTGAQQTFVRSCLDGDYPAFSASALRAAPDSPGWVRLFWECSKNARAAVPAEVLANAKLELAAVRTLLENAAAADVEDRYERERQWLRASTSVSPATPVCRDLPAEVLHQDARGKGAS